MSKIMKAQLKTYKRLKRQKNLKKVRLEGKPNLRMRIALLKMGFDVEKTQDN